MESIYCFSSRIVLPNEIQLDDMTFKTMNSKLQTDKQPPMFKTIKSMEHFLCFEV